MKHPSFPSSLVAAGLLGASLLFAPSSAHADGTTAIESPAPVDSPAKPVERAWYGWQPAIGDGAAALTLTLSTTTDSTPVGVVGMGAYLFTSPTLHLVHGHAGKAALAFALRAALPAIGYGLGTVADSNSGSTPGLLGVGSSTYVPSTATFGFVLGALAAAILDDAVIAREDVKREPAAASFQPSISPTAHGAMLGFSGTF